MLLYSLLAINSVLVIVNAYIMWRNYVTMRMLTFTLNSFVEHQRLINEFLDQQDGVSVPLQPTKRTY